MMFYDNLRYIRRFLAFRVETTLVSDGFTIYAHVWNGFSSFLTLVRVRFAHTKSPLYGANHFGIRFKTLPFFVFARSKPPTFDLGDRPIRFLIPMCVGFSFETAFLFLICAAAPLDS